MFSEHEIQRLISGDTKSIDIKSWKKYTKYIGGFKESSSTIKYFWKVLEEMTPHEQQLVLKFVTSCP